MKTPTAGKEMLYLPFATTTRVLGLQNAELLRKNVNIAQNINFL